MITIEQQLAIIAGDTRDTHLEKVAVTKTFLRQVLAKLQAPCVCPNCEQPKTFDVEKWMLDPSRDQPLLAAAAVNMRKG